ncbi:cytochrome b562 [Acinetobacter sp. MD2]|uniref:cytochrome b562 n=1 Tax=Acinetobacter sp. MD2 TaxID=2600066 RepID=UPI002D1F58D3|nr:cytochrome b562 [Acinetobacter sp. MD2]MEB3767170.1 hypothetical protein [Acinetobacter sp. MD2]
MKFKWALASAFVASFWMNSSFAAGLGQDMWHLYKNYSAFKKAKEAPVALTALTEMQQAATDAKTNVPMKLIGQPDNSPQMQDYQQTFDHLLGEINQAMDLVKAGNLAQAQAQVVPNIDKIRDEGHKKFR